MGMNPREMLGRRIRGLRERLKLTQKEVADQMGFTSSETVSQVERGQRDVKAWELAKLAKLLFVQLSDLLESEDPEALPAVLWRVSPTTQPDVIQANFLNRCEQYAMLETLSGTTIQRQLPQKNVSPAILNFKHARQFADEVRREFGLGDRPAAGLEKILQDRYGVKVWYEELDEGSAAAVIGPFGPAILMNLKEAPWRRNYNFAHEVFHLITWESLPPELLQGDVPLWEKVEKIADSFASCLLLPADSVRDEVESRLEGDQMEYIDLVDIARIFDVSTEALLYRLSYLGILERETVDSVLDDETFRSIDKSTMAANWRVPPEFPERFVRLAFSAYQKGRLSHAKLAQLLETSLLDLTDVLQEYGLDDRESYHRKTQVRSA